MRKFFLIPLMALFACVSAWAVDITTAEDLKTFLEAEGTAEGVLKADVDITSGVINAVGTKTLSTDVEGGVTVTYKTIGVTATDGSNGNANIALTGTLTILGEVKFDGYQEPGKKPFQNKTGVVTDGFTTAGVGTRAIDVKNGGKLILGEVGVTPRPYFHQDVAAKSSYILAVRDGGELVINNVEIQADRCNAIRVYGGTATMNGGLVNSETANIAPYRAYAYSFIALGGHVVINDGHISGVHGGFGLAGGMADIYGGEFETHYITWREGEATSSTKHNYYALYVSEGTICNVYGGKFKVQTPSTGSDQVVLIGNNDTKQYYGVVNIYGGLFQQKMYVSKKYNGESKFPDDVPLTSQWYSSWSSYNAPLPAGCEYQEITSGADYEDGYRWKVVRTNEDVKEVEVPADPEATIPWQQNTTWDPTASATDEGIVPEATTIVAIPKDAKVVVSKDEENKDAVAEQIIVNQGAELVVETGTSLTVGDGGLNIAYGGSLTVEPGATVKIGSAGIVTAEEEALVIESNDDIQGVLLYEPSVDENTQPKATVKLTTKAKQIGEHSYVYERFSIPTVNGSATTYSIEGGIPTSGTYNDNPFIQAVWGWDNATEDWVQLEKFKDMQPFHGYQLTNNHATGGLVYVFEGNLVGNQDKSYDFVANGFHFFGNSYTADINIKKFLDSLDPEVEKTVWVYDPYDKTFKTITKLTANGRVKYGNGEQIKDVRSMQAFLMYLSDGTSGTANVDYESAIWGNPKYNGGGAGAPARYSESNEDWVTIRVSSANGQKDEVILTQSEDFTAAFENGADANKYINKENINLFAATNAGNLAVVATNDLNNTILTFAAGNASEYTLDFGDIEGYEFTLRDNVTGATVLMTEGATYKFNQDANTTIPARFEIIGAPQVTTVIDNVEESAKKSGIYTITGQFLGRDFSNLPAGVYVVNGVKIVK